MDFPVIYSSKGKRLGVLLGAKNLVTKKRINGASGLEFDVNRASGQWKLLSSENIIEVEGEYYTLKVANDGRSDDGKPYGRVTASCAWWEAAEKGRHIPTINFISESPREIIDTAFDGALSPFSTSLRQLSDAEISALGYESVTTPTDIELDKTTPIAVLSKIIGNVGGELYIKGFNFALVKKLGRETGLKFSVDANMKGIDRTCDSTGLITRLYPYATSSMEIDSINGGVDYIDSMYIDRYGAPIVGHKDYKDIEDPNELLRWAKHEFAEDNYERIDIPKLTYRCSIIDLWKLKEYGDTERFEVGDSVLLYDKALDIDVRSRVVEHNYYPFEPIKSYVALGNPPKTVLQLISNLQALESGGGSVLTTADMGSIATGVVNEVADTIADTVVTEVNNTVNNTVVEFVETKVLTSEVAMILNAWVRYMAVEYLETNFEALDIRLPPPADNKRLFYRASGITAQHIEAELSPSETEDYKTPFGDQIYWSAIDDEENAYKYFSLSDPINTHKPDIPEGATAADIAKIKEELRDKYRVQVRKTIKEHIKKSDAFEKVFNADGSSTMMPRTVWGTGDESGNGKGLNYKNADGFYLTYTLRVPLGDIPAGTEIGIKIDDKGIWYFDVGTGEWEAIGTGGGHIIFDGDGNEMPQRPSLMFQNATVEDDEEGNVTVVTPYARKWKHLHIASNYFTVTWDNDEEDNYLMEFYEDGRISAIIDGDGRRWTFSYE